MNELYKHTLFFLVGLLVVFSCTVGAYYIGKEVILYLYPDNQIRSIDLIPLWLAGFIIELLMVFFVAISYRIGERLLDN